MEGGKWIETEKNNSRKRRYAEGVVQRFKAEEGRSKVPRVGYFNTFICRKEMMEVVGKVERKNKDPEKYGVSLMKVRDISRRCESREGCFSFFTFVGNQGIADRGAGVYICKDFKGNRYFNERVDETVLCG